MTPVKRIVPSAVRDMRHKGDEILLVCAYKDEEKCEKYQIDDAVSFQEFKRHESNIGKDQNIAFYCD